MSRLTFDLVLVLITAGLSLCLSLLSFGIGLRLQQNKKIWILLGLMGLFEAFYCFAFYNYIVADDWNNSFFWIGLICIVMPHMTVLYASLTKKILTPTNSWLHRLPQLTFLAALIFSILMASDLFLATNLVVKDLKIDLLSLHKKQIIFNPIGQMWLGTVNTVFCTCAFLLMRAFKNGAKRFLPLTLGSIAYFISIISDFNLVFGLYDFYFTQHLGFTLMVIGFVFFMLQDYIYSVEQLQKSHAEIQKYREQLLHGEKLKLMGTMSAFLAHEIRNPITVIRWSVTTILRKTPEHIRPEIESYISKINSTIDLMVNMISTFHAFSKKNKKVELQRHSLFQIVTNSIELAKFRNESNLVHPTLLFDQSIELLCNANHLTQCIVNLINNSCDALLKQENKWIKIDAKTTVEEVLIVFSDSGPCPLDLVKKIDTPFETTKDDGTGLGLGISKMLMEQQNGTFKLDISSTNTTFILSIKQI